jgi:hypothetical protein
VIFFKTGHALLQGRDDADIQFRIGKRGFFNKRIPLKLKLFLCKRKQLTHYDLNGIVIGKLVEDGLKARVNGH